MDLTRRERDILLAGLSVSIHQIATRADRGDEPDPDLPTETEVRALMLRLMTDKR